MWKMGKKMVDDKAASRLRSMGVWLRRKLEIMGSNLRTTGCPEVSDTFNVVRIMSF